jgi:DNA polymerase I-like protein with 3'-5' exonuclease and polymerase domains
MAYSMYDPRLEGALCDECPLQGTCTPKPIFHGEKSDKTLLFLSDAPKKASRYQHGPSLPMQQIVSAIESEGYSVQDVSLGTLIACAPNHPKGYPGALKVFKAQIKKTRSLYKALIKKRTAQVRQHNINILHEYKIRLAQWHVNYITTKAPAAPKRPKSATEKTFQSTYNAACRKHTHQGVRAQRAYDRQVEKEAKRISRLNAQREKQGKRPLPMPEVEAYIPPVIEMPPEPPARVEVDTTPPSDFVFQKLPHECCYPRLVHHLKSAKYVVALGLNVGKYLTGLKKLKDDVGLPVGVVAEPLKALGLDTVPWTIPVAHPGSFIYKDDSTGSQGIFRHFVGKALRAHKRGGFFWKDPTPSYKHSTVQYYLRELIAMADRVVAENAAPIDVAIDIETGPNPANGATGLEPVWSKTRCVGFAYGQRTLIAPIHLITGEYVGSEVTKELIIKVVTHKGLNKITHNGAFDRPGLRKNFAEVTGPTGDTLNLHHILESEIKPHSLSHVSALALEQATSWKGLHGGGDHGISETNNAALWLYCAIDCWRTLKTHEKLKEALALAEGMGRGLIDLYRQASEGQRWVAEMCYHGLPINLATQSEVQKYLHTERDRCVSEYTQAIEAQLKKVSTEREQEFYRRFAATANKDEIKKGRIPSWGSPDRGYTPTRSSQTALVLELFGIRTDPTPSGGVKVGAEDIIQNLPFVEDDDLEEATRFVGTKLDARSPGAGYLGAMAAEKLDVTFCQVKPIGDLCMRPSWKQHGTVTGRYSAVDPNLMNVPAWLRKMYEAPKGWKLVGADYSAVELWVVAIYTQSLNLLEALRSGDVHRNNCENLFKISFEAILRESVSTELLWSGDRSDPRNSHASLREEEFTLVEVNPKKFRLDLHIAPGPRYNAAIAAYEAAWDKLQGLRTRAKGFVFAGNYRGGAGMILNKMLPFAPEMTLYDIIALQEQWRALNPNIFAKPDINMDVYYRRLKTHGVGWVTGPFGRRRYWADQTVKITDVANFPIQSGAGYIVNEAMIRIGPKIKALGGHLVAQIHDAFYVMVPEDNAEQAKVVLETEMPGKYTFQDGLAGEWSFPVEAKIGQRWSELA